MAKRLGDITTVSDTGIVISHNIESNMNSTPDENAISVSRGRVRGRGEGIYSPSVMNPGLVRKSMTKLNQKEKKGDEITTRDVINSYMENLATAVEENPTNVIVKDINVGEDKEVVVALIPEVAVKDVEDVEAAMLDYVENNDGEDRAALVEYAAKENEQNVATVLVIDTVNEGDVVAVVEDVAGEEKEDVKAASMLDHINDVEELVEVADEEEEEVTVVVVKNRDKEEADLAAAVVVNGLEERDDLAISSAVFANQDQEVVSAVLIENIDIDVGAAVEIKSITGDNVVVVLDEEVVSKDKKDEDYTKDVDASTQTELLQPNQYQKIVDQLNDSTNQLGV